MKPTLGRVVIFSSKNDDGVQSPATVLRTRDTTVPLEQHKEGPHVPGVLPDDFVLDLASDHHVDLLVHGLVKDYRVYNVPVSILGEPGTWNWPQRLPE